MNHDNAHCSDYIKREDAIRQIVKTSAQNELDIPAIGTVIYILSEMDSADVRENVRGEWIDRGKNMTIRWQCSECGRRDTHIYNFCPNCGADMRGDKNVERICSGRRREQTNDPIH